VIHCTLRLLEEDGWTEINKRKRKSGSGSTSSPGTRNSSSGSLRPKRRLSVISADVRKKINRLMTIVHEIKNGKRVYPFDGHESSLRKRLEFEQLQSLLQRLLRDHVGRFFRELFQDLSSYLLMNIREFRSTGKNRDYNSGIFYNS
jgi:hypothetical protein